LSLVACAEGAGLRAEGAGFRAEGAGLGVEGAEAEGAEAEGAELRTEAFPWGSDHTLESLCFPPLVCIASSTRAS